MECPTEFSGKQEQWARLFDNFQPPTEIEAEMAKRYFIWFNLYQGDKAIVDKEGTVTVARNGVPYPNPHFTNMLKAESEMRRLFKQIEKHFEEDNKDGGEFSNL